MSGLLTLGAAGGAAQRTGRELAGEVALVVHRTALVRGRRAVLGREPTRLREVRLRRLLAAQEVLRLDRREVRGADRGQPDPDVGDRVATVQPQGGTGGRHRPVTDPTLDLLVRAAAAGADREPDLDEQLTVADDRLVRALVELPGRDGARAVVAADDAVRVHRGERRGEVLRRVGLAQRAADGAAVA